MVGDERACGRASGYGLEYGRLHLHVAVGVEVFAHGVEHPRALEEDFLHAFVDHEVHVAAAVTLLRVGECVVGLPVLHLDDGQRAEALGEERYLLGVDGYLAHLSAEHEAAYAYEVSDVEELLEDYVVLVFVLAGAEVVAADVDLYPSESVLQLHERSLAHDASAHDASGDGNLAFRLKVVGESLFYFVGVPRHGEFRGGIRVDAAFAQGFEAAAAHCLLFAEFLNSHCYDFLVVVGWFSVFGVRAGCGAKDGHVRVGMP